MRPSVVNGTTSTPPGGVRFGEFAGEGSVRSSPTQRQSCRPSSELPAYANFMQIGWNFVPFIGVVVKVSWSVRDEVTRFHSSSVSFVHWPRRLTRRVHLRRATIQRKFDPKFRRGFSVLLSGRRNGAQSRHFGRSLAAFIDSDNLTDDSHSTCDFFSVEPILFHRLHVNIWTANGRRLTVRSGSDHYAAVIWLNSSRPWTHLILNFCYSIKLFIQLLIDSLHESCPEDDSKLMNLSTRWPRVILSVRWNFKIVTMT